MCGVSAVLRGQDAAGIAACEGGRVYQCKGNGLASKVFDDGKRVADLPGFMAISHVRYPTWGSSSASEAQPFYVNSPFGLSMGVNGNLVNTPELRSFLDLEARRHVNTDSDSELLLNVFAHALNQLGKPRTNVEDVFTALRDVYSRCQGAFACTGMIAGFGILGFRDANGIRPLCLGSRPSDTLEGATDYFMASESVALKQLGFKNIVDVLPGQAVFIQKGGAPQFRQIAPRKSYTPDIFEYVYFSRPESVIDGISVHRSRENMGLKLAKRVRDVLGEKGVQEIDVVIPVPETSNTAAAVLAKHLDKPYSTAFIKNRYIQRTFIVPGQSARTKSVRRKLSPIESEFRDRVVAIIDDSLVQMAREAGATKVIFVSASPAVTDSHIYGIDLADPAELVAHGRTHKEVAEKIGADELIYQTLEDLEAACIEAAGGKTDIISFEVGVFSGQYKTDVPEGYFEKLSQLRGKKRKRTVGSAKEGEPNTSKTYLVANGGPVNVAARRQRTLDDDDDDEKEKKGPDNRDDIRYDFHDCTGDEASD
ncbi:hypothetical protein ACJ41O_005585 [Fusarium nematophilum]